MQDIVTIRRQLKLVSSTLRQGKLASAVQAVIAAIRLMLSTPLMKAEKDEFSGMIREALDYINNSNEIRKLHPVPLEYEPGKEKQLFEGLIELVEILEKKDMSGVEDIVNSLRARQDAALAKGQEHLDNVDYDSARTVFRAISGEFPKDGKLKSDIGEKFLNAGCYQDAAEYYIEAVDLDPVALHNYNRLAIAFRKMGEFPQAEEYYKRALPLAPNDPYLLFNVARLYLEWGKWNQAVEYGEKSLLISPDFAEAGKLVKFARKNLR